MMELPAMAAVAVVEPGISRTGHLVLEQMEVMEVMQMEVMEAMDQPTIMQVQTAQIMVVAVGVQATMGLQPEDLVPMGW